MVNLVDLWINIPETTFIFALLEGNETQNNGCVDLIFLKIINWKTINKK